MNDICTNISPFSPNSDITFPVTFHSICVNGCVTANVGIWADVDMCRSRSISYVLSPYLCVITFFAGCYWSVGNFIRGGIAIILLGKGKVVH